MSLPPLTEFDDPVARFLEWHHIRCSYLGNDDAAMAKAYPEARKQLKRWGMAFIQLPKDSWPKRFFMSIVGNEAWQGAEIADDVNTEMAMLHHRMAIAMPWTADQGLASQWQKHLEQHEDGELLNDETGLRYKDELPEVLKRQREVDEYNLLSREDRKKYNAKRPLIVKAVAKAADTVDVNTTREFLEQAHEVIKSATESVEQSAPSSKTLRVEKALLNPRNSKDRSRYKSAYFLWGQIKSKPYEIDEQFKMTDSQASEWAGVSKGTNTRDVIAVLINVKAIEKVKRTQAFYKRLA